MRRITAAVGAQSVGEPQMSPAAATTGLRRAARDIDTRALIRPRCEYSSTPRLPGWLLSSSPGRAARSNDGVCDPNAVDAATAIAAAPMIPIRILCTKTSSVDGEGEVRSYAGRHLLRRVAERRFRCAYVWPVTREGYANRPVTRKRRLRCFR